MSQNQVLMYKLEKSGKLTQLSQENIMENLVPVNIIVFYAMKTRRLYIWKGSRASYILRKKIPMIEDTLIKENDRVRVLRHFTVDQDDEPWDFFDQVGVDKSVSKDAMDKWNKLKEEIVEKIKILEQQAADAYNSQDFSLSIEKTFELIELAKEINENEIIDEKLKFIKKLEQEKEQLQMKTDNEEKLNVMILQLEHGLNENNSDEINELYSEINEFLQQHREINLTEDQQVILDNAASCIEPAEPAPIDDNEINGLKQQIEVKRAEIESLFSTTFEDNSAESALTLNQDNIKAIEQKNGEIRSLIDDLTAKTSSIPDREAEFVKEFGEFVNNNEVKIKNLKEIGGIISELSGTADGIEQNLKEVEGLIEERIKDEEPAAPITPESSEEGLSGERAQSLKTEETENEIKTLTGKIDELTLKINDLEDKYKNHIDKISKAESALAIQNTDTVFEKDRLIDSLVKNVKTFSDKIEKLKQEAEAINQNLISKSEKISAIKECNEQLQKVREIFDSDMPSSEKIKQYKEAETIIDSLLSISGKYGFEQYKEQAETYQKKMQLSVEEIEKLNELYERLVSYVEENEANKHYKTAVLNCEKLIDVCKKLEKSDEEQKYSEKLEYLKQLQEELEEAQKKKHEEFIQNIEKFNEVIEVEKDTAPIMEELSVDEVLGDISVGIDEIFDKLTNILDEHRVEVKDEITSTNVLKSASGEVIEQERTTKVQIIPDESAQSSNIAAEDLTEDEQASIQPPSKIIVESGFNNPFDDVLEEAIITDIIPYNFEISEMSVNGESPGEEPEHILTEDGLELQWKFQNVPPKENVKINYELKTRVSRTVIFPLQKTLKIIKTHKNIEALESIGLFRANLKFLNKFEQDLSGVVIEDIIPPEYVYNIKQPDEPPSASSKQEKGALIKWTINNVPVEVSLRHYYKLIELFKFEELKIKVNKLSKELLNNIDDNKDKSALKNSEEIIGVFKEYE